jgi:hypothetical protein
MTTPGGAGTLCVRTFPSARRIGFSHRVGVSSVYLAPARRFAPVLCCSVFLMYVPSALPGDLYVRQMGDA